MNERRDLGVTLLAGALLILSLSYLAQCSSATRRPEPQATGVVPSVPAARSEADEREDAAARRKSVREAAEEEDREESQRVKGVAHALQTLGADPVRAKTFGVPP